MSVIHILYIYIYVYINSFRARVHTLQFVNTVMLDAPGREDLGGESLYENLTTNSATMISENNEFQTRNIELHPSGKMCFEIKGFVCSDRIIGETVVKSPYESGCKVFPQITPN